MKRVKPTSDELRPEYKRSDFKKLERGKYFERIGANSNVVVLDPEVAAVFPNSAAVNRALHSLVDVPRKFHFPFPLPFPLTSTSATFRVVLSSRIPVTFALTFFPGCRSASFRASFAFSLPSGSNCIT